MIKEKHTNLKQGFTLLELLIVVIIIGILATVALPQYQLVRDKSEFAKYQSMVTSLKDAYDEHILAYGEGTRKFENLSLTIPSDFTKVIDGNMMNCVQNSDMFCCMSPSDRSMSGLINCGKNDLSVIYAVTMLNKNNTPGDRVGRCLAHVDNARANRLCASLGKKGNITNTWIPTTGSSNSVYRNYILK